MSGKTSLDEICPPSVFAEKHPNLFNGPGTPKMDYLIRQRHINGLVECGAVIEPVKRRPLVVPSKFLAWLLERGGCAA